MAEETTPATKLSDLTLGGKPALTASGNSRARKDAALAMPQEEAKKPGRRKNARLNNGQKGGDEDKTFRDAVQTLAASSRFTLTAEMSEGEIRVITTW